jgi:hypothetical protein
MPAIKDPDKEARRVAAVRAALIRDQRWKVATRPENFTAAGLRRRGQNSTKSGADSLAVKWATRYCEAIARMLAR